MKINNFIPSVDFKNSGLAIKEMRNLKQVVALFGKNGSGKSRLLRALVTELTPILVQNSHLNNAIHTIDTVIDKEVREKRLEMLLKEKAEIRKNIEIDLGDSIVFINARNIEVEGNSNMNENEFRDGTLDLIQDPGFTTVKQNCAKFIKALCKSEIAKEYHEKIKNKTFHKSHEKNKNKNIELLHLLKDVVKKIMNKSLDYSTDEYLTPIVTLDDRILNPSELSDGERELLAYCTYLVLQGQGDESFDLKNKILILDELELFLHPKAHIDLINGLRNLVGPNGQIWIATHSLAILSILDRDEIWLMENGNVISPSIETPNKVLESLVGEENVDSLENFISSQYEWASIQFALECLFPPLVIPYKENDVQQNQVTDKLTASSKPIKILDFGAGKGRIAQEIIRDQSLSSNIYYQPLEDNKDFHGQLKELTSQLQNLSSIHQEIEREVLDTYEKLNENKYHSFFDYIFIVNVLHEIPLNKWNSILNTLLNSLKDDGSLIILEDQAIPRGENAHEYGFLIFDTEEFKELFSRKNPLQPHKHADPKYMDRLTCIEIPKLGSAVNSTSINDALSRKKINCKTAINRLREKKNKTSKDGRVNSFLTQLYANVDMALADYNF